MNTDTPRVIGGAAVLAELSFWDADRWSGTVLEDRMVQVRREALDAEVPLPSYLKEGLRQDFSVEGHWRAGPPHETIWYSLWREEDGSWTFRSELYGRWGDAPPRTYPDYGLFAHERTARSWLIEHLRGEVEGFRALIDAYEQRIQALEAGERPTDPLPNLHEECHD